MHFSISIHLHRILFLPAHTGPLICTALLTICDSRSSQFFEPSSTVLYPVFYKIVMFSVITRYTPNNCIS